MWHSGSHPTNIQNSQRGFTLVELLIVMALIGVLATLSVVNLVKPQQNASLTGTIDVLVADLRSQQLKAMSGNTASASSAQPHGIYIAADSYTLYKGSSYSGGDSDNFTIEPDGVSFSTTLPSSQVSFQKASGEPSGFSAGSDTITVSNLSGESKTLTINRFGVVTVN